MDVILLYFNYCIFKEKLIVGTYIFLFVFLAFNSFSYRKTVPEISIIFAVKAIPVNVGKGLIRSNDDSCAGTTIILYYNI
jgi:hypothetical protein